MDTSGVLYVTDRNNNRIRRITPDGEVTTLAGSGSVGYANGRGETASFNGPCGVAMDASGVIYVVDFNNHRIRRISPDGEVTTLAGSGARSYANGRGEAASFNLPYGVAIDASGVIYVADYDNHRIRKLVRG